MSSSLTEDEWDCCLMYICIHAKFLLHIPTVKPLPGPSQDKHRIQNYLCKYDERMAEEMLNVKLEFVDCGEEE